VKTLRLALVFAVLLMLALASAWLWRALAPGGAHAKVQAPAQLRGGEIARLELLVSVWGAGGAPASRYRELSLELGPADAPWLTRPPDWAQHGDRESRFGWQFVPPLGKAQIGSVDYRIRFKLDGQAQLLDGRLPWLPD
jgi:hypothetical protein